jgi:hypothetical protein
MRAKYTDALLDKMDAAETALNEQDPKIMRTIATEMNRSNKISTSAPVMRGTNVLRQQQPMPIQRESLHQSILPKCQQ